MKTIVEIASQVTEAEALTDAAKASAAIVKFGVVVDFALLAAAQVRGVINTGSNLETDAKGRYIALRDATKANRALLVSALRQGAGLDDNEKTPPALANIASLARTAAEHFVGRQVETGSLIAAKSADDMRAALESMMLESAGRATYDALEKARSRKWEAPSEEAPEVEAPPANDASDSAPDSDPFATEAPVFAAAPVTTEGDEAQSLAGDTGQAFATLRAAMAQGEEIEGFGDFLAEALQYWQDRQTAALANAEAA